MISILERILTTESELRKKAIKDGLRVGKKVKIFYVKRIQGVTIRGVHNGIVIGLYPSIFVVEIQGKTKIRESFQYKQILLGEVKL